MNSEFMREAIRLAREGVEGGYGGPFGAVVVQGDGLIVGRGFNRVLGTHDPTAHAEITAIRDASHRLGRYWLEDCSIYITCEPCMMCLGAIHWARIGKIYYAATGHDAAAIGFADEYIARELCRPVEERRLPMKQAMRTEALAVFDLWRNKADRQDY